MYFKHFEYLCPKFKKIVRKIISILLLSLIISQSLMFGTIALNKEVFFSENQSFIKDCSLYEIMNSLFEINYGSKSSKKDFTLKSNDQLNTFQHKNTPKSFVKKCCYVKQSYIITPPIYQQKFIKTDRHILFERLLI